MSAAKHTPGPWTWRPNYRGLTSQSGDDVLTFYEYENMWLTYGASQEANARLIAAAPDLLKALRDLCHVHVPSAQRWERARAVLAKVEGAE